MFIRRLQAYLPVLLWMSLIFIGSTDLGSSQRTSRIIGPFLRWVYPDVSDETIHAVQAFVRKSAHVTVYAVLSALIWRGRRVARGATRLFTDWNWIETWCIVGVCALYAVTDELHQSFVSTRQASALDVGFDSFGALCALLGIWAFGRWKRC